MRFINFFASVRIKVCLTIEKMESEIAAPKRWLDEMGKLNASEINLSALVIYQTNGANILVILKNFKNQLRLKKLITERFLFLRNKMKAIN